MCCLLDIVNKSFEHIIKLLSRSLLNITKKLHSRHCLLKWSLHWSWEEAYESMLETDEGDILNDHKQADCRYLNSEKWVGKSC